MKECHTQNGAVRKLFSDTSRQYAGLFSQRKTGKNFLFQRRLSLARAAAGESTGRLFDCATGSGEISTAILTAGKFEEATLLDLSPQMLELTAAQLRKLFAGNKEPKINLVCDDVFHFALENAHCKYDLVVCLGLIAHTGRLPELLKLLRALLAKNATILLQSTLLDHWGARVERWLGEERYFRKHGYRIKHFSHRDIESACADAGLRIAAIRRYAVGLPFGDRLWGWGNYQLERVFQSWADAHGAEAIYILKSDAAA